MGAPPYSTTKVEVVRLPEGDSTDVVENSAVFMATAALYDAG